MRGFNHWLAAGAGLALLAAPAAACLPPPYQPPPMLPGETDEAYRVRIEAQARRDAEAARVQWETAQRTREDDLWSNADRVVVAEVTGVSGWREDRRGIEYRIVTLRPLATARGPRTTQRVRLRSHDGGTLCFGPQGPVYPVEGRLVLFAGEGSLSDATVMGWSDASLSTHPETLALLSRTEGRSD